VNVHELDDAGHRRASPLKDPTALIRSSWHTKGGRPDICGHQGLPLRGGVRVAFLLRPALQYRRAAKVGSMPMPKIEVIRAHAPEIIGDSEPHWIVDVDYGAFQVSIPLSRSLSAR
jgi:hypothetical protein